MHQNKTFYEMLSSNTVPRNSVLCLYTDFAGYIDNIATADITLESDPDYKRSYLYFLAPAFFSRNLVKVVFTPKNDIKDIIESTGNTLSEFLREQIINLRVSDNKYIEGVVHLDGKNLTTNTGYDIWRSYERYRKHPEYDVEVFVLDQQNHKSYLNSKLAYDSQQDRIDRIDKVAKFLNGTAAHYSDKDISLAQFADAINDDYRQYGNLLRFIIIMVKRNDGTFVTLSTDNYGMIKLSDNPILEVLSVPNKFSFDKLVDAMETYGSFYDFYLMDIRVAEDKNAFYF